MPEQNGDSRSRGTTRLRFRDTEPVDKAEARAVLQEVLAPLRQLGHTELAQRFIEADDAENTEIQGPSGVTYQVQLQAFWDTGSPGPIRVMGCIDDGGWRAFAPLCGDFFVEDPGASQFSVRVRNGLLSSHPYASGPSLGWSLRQMSSRLRGLLAQLACDSAAVTRACCCRHGRGERDRAGDSRGFRR
jgi:hypothetical protein